MKCDRCGCWISADEAEVVPAKESESGYDGNGFPAYGGGTVVVCPQCAEFSTLPEGTKMAPFLGEIDLGEGGLFRPAFDELWELIDPEKGRWEIHGDHIVFPVDDEIDELVAKGYEPEGEGYIARGVYLAVTVEDITAHPQKTGWIEYQID